MKNVTKALRLTGLALILAALAMPAFGQRTVTLNLNTATLADTLHSDGSVFVRGTLGDNNGADDNLPDGNVIGWGDGTTLSLTNTGGDYWNISFQVPNDSTLSFKFFTPDAEGDGKPGGWEDGGNNFLEAGTTDTTFAMHFFNKVGDSQAYDYTPFGAADTVEVLFRVYMNTEQAASKGYDPLADGFGVGVRGDDLNGKSPLDWGSNLVLTRETETESTPGYDIFSGIGKYDTTGTQAYKFVIINGDSDPGWEDTADGQNRTFAIPTSDSTSYWSYFGDSPALGAEELPTATVLFAVDLTPMETIGIFDRARGDTLEVRGGFNGWNNENPDDSRLLKVPGENVYEAAIPLTAVAGTEIAYKYFLNLNAEAFEAQWGREAPSGWEEPLSTTGANRTFNFEGDPNNDQDLAADGVTQFDDITSYNIMEDDSVMVTFSVDMASAFDAQDRPMTTADTVWIQIDDPLWLFTQNFADAVVREYPLLNATDGVDSVWTGVVKVKGPTYNGYQYKYVYGSATDTKTEDGGTTSGLGRRRTRFVTQNDDASWPAEWALPAEAYQQTGNLPFEVNPALTVAIEDLGGEQPNQITLSDNYPNPFNPTTTFSYTLNATQNVSVKVYDMLGRVVATLVNGRQAASTYEVSFDATNLASGLYIYRLETAHYSISKKMVLLK